MSVIQGTTIAATNITTAIKASTHAAVFILATEYRAGNEE
jgi:hypothetical protein